VQQILVCMKKLKYEKICIAKIPANKIILEDLQYEKIKKDGLICFFISREITYMKK